MGRHSRQEEPLSSQQESQIAQATERVQAPINLREPVSSRKSGRTGAANRARASLGTQAPKGSKRGATRRSGGGKSNRNRNLLSTLLIVVGVVLLGIAAFLWGQSQLRYMKQEKINNELAAYVTVYDTELHTEESKAPEVDWAGLKAINDDVVGWLQVPGTTINYPVYQAEDNDYYLRTSATGEWSVGGQLFIDYACTAPGMVDQLTQIYGHHLLDGTMFEQIAAMDEQERFDEIDTVWYVTEGAAYECEPLLLYYTQPEDEAARTFNWSTEEEFHTYLSERLNRAVTKRDDAGVIISGAHHVLTLVTCNYYDGYGRTVLICVPKDEAAAAKSAG